MDMEVSECDWSQDEEDGLNSTIKITSENDLLALKQDLFDEMEALEREFVFVRDSLYNEKIKLIGDKIEEVKNGTAPELVKLVECQDESKKRKIEISHSKRILKKEVAKNELAYELNNARLSSNEDKSKMHATMLKDIEQKISVIQAKSNNKTDDVESTNRVKKELNISLSVLNTKEELQPRKRVSTLSCTSPHMIYNLRQPDIDSDILKIQQALKDHLYPDQNFAAKCRIKSQTQRLQHSSKKMLSAAAD